MKQVDASVQTVVAGIGLSFVTKENGEKYIEFHENNFQKLRAFLNH